MLNQAQIAARLLAAAELMEAVQTATTAYGEAEQEAGRTGVLTARQHDFYRAAQAAVIAACMGE